MKRCQSKDKDKEEINKSIVKINGNQNKENKSNIKKRNKKRYKKKKKIRRNNKETNRVKHDMNY